VFVTDKLSPITTQSLIAPISTLSCSTFSVGPASAGFGVVVTISSSGNVTFNSTVSIGVAFVTSSAVPFS